MTHFAPLSLRIVQPEWADVVPSPAHDSLSATQRVDYVRRHPDSYLRVTGAGSEEPDTAPPTDSK